MLNSLFVLLSNFKLQVLLSGPVNIYLQNKTMATDSVPYKQCQRLEIVNSDRDLILQPKPGCIDLNRSYYRSS